MSIVRKQRCGVRIAARKSPRSTSSTAATVTFAGIARGVGHAEITAEFALEEESEKA
jgi:hypothetical protein